MGCSASIPIVFEGSVVIEEIKLRGNICPSITCKNDGSILVCTNGFNGPFQVLEYPPNDGGDGKVIIEEIKKRGNICPSITCKNDGSILVCTNGFNGPFRVLENPSWKQLSATDET